jgi:hypothetical protein
LKKQIQTDFNDVMIANKSVKNAEVVEKSDYCDQKFEKIVSDLSLQSIKLGFSNYIEIANFLKQEIRAKTGLECFVSVGLLDFSTCQTWLYNNRKFISLKIGNLLININQMHVRNN